MGIRISLGIAAVAVSLAVGAAAPVVRAQDALPSGQGFNLHLFQHAVDSKGQFVVNGTDILGAGETSFGLIVDWARGLSRIGTTMSGGQMTLNAPLVDNMFTGVLHANVGIANFLVLGVQLPAHLVTGPSYTGTDTTLSAIPGYSPQMGGLNFQGFGTAILHAKLRLLRSERTHFGLALILQAGIPLMHGPENFAGDPGFTLIPSLAAEWRPTSAFRVDLNVGYRWFEGTGATLGGVTYGRPITAGIGLSYRLGNAVDVVAEAFAESYTNNLFTEATTPVEADLGLKIFVVSNSYLFIGAGRRLDNAPAAADLRTFVGFVFEPSIGDRDGDGLRDDVDQCPDQPEDFDGFQDADGCPEPDNDQDGILDHDDQCPLIPENRNGIQDADGCPESDNSDRDGDGIIDSADQCPDQPEDHDNFQDQDGCPDPDNDQDGIPDVDDLCPNQPEDRDGFEDADGCPDPDNDHDRIPDVRDTCPNQPETYNGFQDEDGCPDQGIAVLEDNNIRILQAINFETNSAQIRQDSMPIIEAVAATLVGNPQITLVQVQGHADERGNDEHNLTLTRDRAASVMRALVERHVEESRLHSAGYGERCPVAQGHNEAAWSRNRRVVFLILRTQAGPTHVDVACPAGQDLIPDEDRDIH